MTVRDPLREGSGTVTESATVIVIEIGTEIETSVRTDFVIAMPTGIVIGCGIASEADPEAAIWTGETIGDHAPLSTVMEDRLGRLLTGLAPLWEIELLRSDDQDHPVAVAVIDTRHTRAPRPETLAPPQRSTHSPSHERHRPAEALAEPGLLSHLEISRQLCSKATAATASPFPVRHLALGPLAMATAAAAAAAPSHPLAALRPCELLPRGPPPCVAPTGFPRHRDLRACPDRHPDPLLNNSNSNSRSRVRIR